MKNKEIEELLNELKCKDNYSNFIDSQHGGNDYYYLLERQEAIKLLSYIEQLETNYKEANESITWWQNRYNAIVKQNDDSHKNVVKLENNRDKAIEMLTYKQNAFSTCFSVCDVIDILKGDSDENK